MKRAFDSRGNSWGNRGLTREFTLQPSDVSLAALQSGAPLRHAFGGIGWLAMFIRTTLELTLVPLLQQLLVARLGTLEFGLQDEARLSVSRTLLSTIHLG